MKKILILSYFFPPSTITGSYRVNSWAKHLSKFGFYPIIVTRTWNENINNYYDLSSSFSNEIIHEKHENYEVYYMPYKPNLRDKIINKYGENKFQILRKFLTFIIWWPNRILRG